MGAGTELMYRDLQKRKVRRCDGGLMRGLTKGIMKDSKKKRENSI